MKFFPYFYAFFCFCAVTNALDLDDLFSFVNTVSKLLLSTSSSSAIKVNSLKLDSKNHEHDDTKLAISSTSISSSLGGGNKADHVKPNQTTTTTTKTRKTTTSTTTTTTTTKNAPSSNMAKLLKVMKPKQLEFEEYFD